MSSSTMEEFTPSPNNCDRSMLSVEINNIFDGLVRNCYPDLEKDYAFIRPLEGDARRDYGDYVCFSVLELCEDLRKENPDLFDKKKPNDIAKEICEGFRFEETDMIRLESLQVRVAGIITFNLHGSWIAQRIHNMLINGIDTWAPDIFETGARAVFVSRTLNTWDLTAKMLRADCIKHALVQIYLYSGIDVLDACRGGYGSPSNNIDADLETIRYEVCIHKADILVHVNPQLDGEYIQKCFSAARGTEWLQSAQLACCGYRTFSSDQKEKLDSLWHECINLHRYTSLIDLAGAAGYSRDELFGCLLKYTWLKSHRLAELSFSIEEMLHREGNSLVYLLSTRALIRSLIKDSNSTGVFLEAKEALAGKGERELGLHLVEFTGVIEKVCLGLVPHIVCEYLFDLSKLFHSYDSKIRRGKPKVGLCRATEAVMDKCFHLLGINPGCVFEHYAFWNFLEQPVKETRETFFERVTRETVNRIIPSPSETRYSQSRFELFTMSVSVSDPDFDEGSIFGKLWVKDALLARAHGWTRSDAKDFCYISCFNHEWHESLDIGYDSLIPFGDPSGRRSVPVSSSVELDLLLHAMSKSKDQCYLIFHGKHNESLSKFWEEDPKTKCGTLKFESDIGRVLVNFILLKDAVDASMELTCTSTNPGVPIQICGSIMVYYGDDVVKDDGGILGQYKATIFKTDKFKLTGGQVVLPLHRSLLAVPANGSLNIEAFFMDVESEEEYVRGMTNYPARPGTTDNWPLECINLSFNLKVAWSL